MANAEKDVLDEIEEPKKKGMKLPVLIGVILGIIIVQVGIMFAAIKFMAPADAHNEKDKHKTEQEAEENAQEIIEDLVGITLSPQAEPAYSFALVKSSVPLYSRSLLFWVGAIAFATLFI